MRSPGARTSFRPDLFPPGAALTAGVDFGDKPSESGSLRVTTSGGTATFPIRYAAH